MSDSISPLFAAGKDLAQALFADEFGDLKGFPLPAEDDLPKTIVTWLYGYLLNERSSLDVRTKVLSLIAMSTATGNLRMLGDWIAAAPKAGCTRAEVRETIVTMMVYAGFPAARDGLETLNKAWPLDSAVAASGAPGA